MAQSPNDTSGSPDVDVVIIGAGIAGIHQLYELVQRNLRVRLIDAADGVGGTWYWNRYPGCRFDVESYTYQYFFNDELLREWSWTEEFAGQPEIERYLNYVVDKLDLRPHIQLGTRVTAATWDEDGGLWRTTTECGQQITSTFLVTAVGILSAPQNPPVEGLDDFRGEMYHTGRWPRETVDFEGKRVAVIGTGSSGVQIVPAVLNQVASMTVFQRSANWCTPLNNRPITPERMESIRARYDEIHELVSNTPSGFMHTGQRGSILDLTPEQQTEFLESIYRESGMTVYYRNYEDVTTNRAANEVVNRFLAGKIRERVKDPETAELLIPKDHGFAMKRPPQENGYYEAFNEDYVTLVSLRDEPIVRLVADGIETTRRKFEVDLIVLASGFDAVTGSYTRIDIRGRDGVRLADAWAKGPRTYFGLATPGFPNLFMAGGPQSTRGNAPRFTEVQVPWIADTIADLAARSCILEASEAAADAWTEHVDQQAGEPIFLNPGATSWMWGTNTPGKATAILVGTEALPIYRASIRDARVGGYHGFVLRPRKAVSVIN